MDFAHLYHDLLWLGLSQNRERPAQVLFWRDVFGSAGGNDLPPRDQRRNVKSLSWLAALLLVIVILIASFFLLVSSPDVYQWLMKQNNVYQDVDLPENLIDRAAVTIAEYMTGRAPHLLIEYQGDSLFKAQEVFHMYEVRRIFSHMRTGLIFCGLVLAGLVIVLGKQRNQVFLHQFWLMLGLFGLLSMAALFFDQAFLWMHQLLFNNVFWAFHPSHYLIRLLPEGFFLGFLLLTAVIALGLSTACYLVGRSDRKLKSYE